MIARARISSPWGWIEAAASQRGLTSLLLPRWEEPAGDPGGWGPGGQDVSRRGAVGAAGAVEQGQADAMADTAAGTVEVLTPADSFQVQLFRQLGEELSGYWRGRPVRFRAVVDLDGAPSFARRVWEEISAAIPFGEVCSYKWLAEKLGTRGYRAVGRALGANPLAVIIPCHRVLRTDGGLGGYTGGLRWKRELLALEGVRFLDRENRGRPTGRREGEEGSRESRQGPG